MAQHTVVIKWLNKPDTYGTFKQKGDAVQEGEDAMKAGAISYTVRLTSEPK